MKRWNGWGDSAIEYPLPSSARAFLRARLGPLDPSPDASLEELLPGIPAGRLPAHPLIDTAPETRLRYARGHSLPDWVALRCGRISCFPDGVALPRSPADVRSLLDLAQRHGLHLIPYGGGTSVVGHINPLPSETPTLSLSLESMDRLLELDETSRLVTFEAGVTGPRLEAQLAERGYTLGHFPQSFEYSTLGGWIATRSSGQQSYYYGRIEDLFAGGRLETPQGRLELPVLPASAAGPDLRQLVLGSEGRLGVITQATLRVRLRPETEGFYGVFFPTWEQGVAAVRQAAQEALPVSMMRLSNPLESEVTLELAGQAWLEWAKRGLGWLGYGAERCLLIFGATGRTGQVSAARRGAVAICRQHGGLFTGSVAGRTWRKNRFRSAYLRNTLWEAGVAVDTLETALPWRQVLPAAAAIPQAIRQAALAYDENVLAFAHLSHIYPDGASIYTTFLFRRNTNPDRLLDLWRAMKHAASQVIQRHGGTISHQHGVGLDHAAYLPAEKGSLGVAALANLCRNFDPDGIMNPGKLLLLDM
jgi:alkyldihydroxyacetonephosphate synthase